MRKAENTIRTIAILLALLSTPAPPPFTATWAGVSAVRLSWQQPASQTRACLYRYYGAPYPAGICYSNLAAGPMQVDLPGAFTHPAYIPADGDRYELRFENVVVGSAALGERAVHRVWLPVFRG